jgi:hypothetical protein
VWLFLYLSIMDTHKHACTPSRNSQICSSCMYNSANMRNSPGAFFKNLVCVVRYNEPTPLSNAL